MRNEYEEMKRGCVMDFDTSSFLISHLSFFHLGFHELLGSSELVSHYA